MRVFFMAAPAELYAPERYQFVDTFPEMADARQMEREAATDLLRSRQAHVDQGLEMVFLPTDALSTADKVLEAATTYGEGSAEHTERYRGLVLDCQRLVGEWYRKKKSEYFPPVKHAYDADTEDFFSHGLSIRQMTENALCPLPDNPEEEARRINERVEETTTHVVRKLGGAMLQGAGIRTISECTDKAIADYAVDMREGNRHRGYGGYVPEIEKVMIRDIRLDPETNDRHEEQLGLPGIYITHEIIQIALKRMGVDADGMDKTELHGSQIIVHDDLMSFAALLDAVASEEWCTNVFMGEEVAPDFRKNYNTFREEALARQEALKDLAETTAQFVLDLARDGFDRAKAPGHVEDFVKKLLLTEAKRDMAVAEQMFDKQTAIGLQEVASLEQQGRYDEAFLKMQEVERAAPGGGFCGAGSCGLESLNASGKEGEELMKKLKAESTDTLVRDKERACRCGSKNIVYAYNKTKVNKYCESCGSFESKASKVAA
jgi:hypothetical protein